MTLSRRRLLAAGAAAGSVALAGCSLFDEARDIEGSVAANDVDGVSIENLDQNFTAIPEGRALAMTARLRNNREETIPGGTLCATFAVFDADGAELGAVEVEMKREFPAGEALPISGVYSETPDAVASYEVSLSTC